MSVLVLAEYADEPIDVKRTLELVLVHDLVEIHAGDTPRTPHAGNGSAISGPTATPTEGTGEPTLDYDGTQRCACALHFFRRKPSRWPCARWAREALNAEMRGEITAAQGAGAGQGHA